MIDDYELVQNAIIRNHILVSEKVLQETGYEKEWIMEAFQRFNLESHKKVKEFHGFLKMQRVKQSHTLGPMLEKELHTEVENLLIDGKIRKCTNKDDVIEYTF